MGTGEQGTPTPQEFQQGELKHEEFSFGSMVELLWLGFDVTFEMARVVLATHAAETSGRWFHVSVGLHAPYLRSRFEDVPTHEFSSARLEEALCSPFICNHNEVSQGLQAAFRFGAGAENEGFHA